MSLRLLTAERPSGLRDGDRGTVSRGCETRCGVPDWRRKVQGHRRRKQGADGWTYWLAEWELDVGKSS
jgi:hypothetical protein